MILNFLYCRLFLKLSNTARNFPQLWSQDNFLGWMLVAFLKSPIVSPSRYTESNFLYLVFGYIYGGFYDLFFFMFTFFHYKLLQLQIREEDEEIEADGANYQLEMMRCLREVNVDNNTVGWYVLLHCQQSRNCFIEFRCI